MTRFGTLKRALIKVGVAAAIGCMQVSPGIAGVEDSVFFISADGSSVAFDVHDVSRREVLDRLLTSNSIELEWVDAAAGDERISGAFRGSTDAVLQRLLAQTDFVAVYDRDGDNTRIARLIIVGKAASRSKSMQLAGEKPATGLPATLQPPALTPVEGTAELKPPSPQDLATPLFVPAPPGTAAPVLVPHSGAGVTLPLLAAPGGKPAQ